mmetsp:Transcript_30669/g.22739  ORF Transcript_30669/g.22739 Transcript_30669/m.22739 type:complete len:116 (+) Transcript_30669:561-908(+)
MIEKIQGVEEQMSSLDAVIHGKRISATEQEQTHVFDLMSDRLQTMKERAGGVFEELNQVNDMLKKVELAYLSTDSEPITTQELSRLCPLVMDICSLSKMINGQKSLLEEFDFELD